MLKKLNGFKQTAEAKKVMAQIENRAKGAALFLNPVQNKPTSQNPSL
jgi:hypothetical protein